MPPATDNPRNVPAFTADRSSSSDGYERIAGRTNKKRFEYFVPNTFSETILIAIRYTRLVANTGILVIRDFRVLYSILAKRVDESELDPIASDR